MKSQNIVLSVFIISVAVIFGYINIQGNIMVAEDAFISFRYAKNLVEGYGLAWNPGYYVEGYTNFLWVMLMSFGMLIGFEPELFSIICGLLAGASILAVLVTLSAKLTSWRSPYIWFVPAVLLASKSFIAWSGGGLETQLFALLGLLSLVAFYFEGINKSQLPYASALFISLVSLTRPDGVLFGVICGVFFAIDLIQKKRSIKSFIVWASIPCVIVGGHLLFRIFYYGEFLPNTFYVKVSGFWFDKGSDYFLGFISDYKLLGTLILSLFPLFVLRQRIHYLFASFLLLYTVYVASVGGDYMGYRLIVPLIPLYYWLVLEGIRSLQVLLGSYKSTENNTIFVQFLFPVFMGLYVVTLTQLGSETMKKHTTVVRHVSTIERQRNFAQHQKREGEFLRQLVHEGILVPTISIAVRGAGALPYYSELETVDIFGLNDKTVSRIELDKRGSIGHEKIAPPWYLEQRKVTMIDAGFNGGNLVFNHNPCAKNKRRHQKVEWYKGKIRCYKAKDRYLAFGSYLPDDQIARIFSRLEKIDEW